MTTSMFRTRLLALDRTRRVPHGHSSHEGSHRFTPYEREKPKDELGQMLSTAPTHTLPLLQVACDLSNDPVALYADSLPGKSTSNSKIGVGKAGGRGRGVGPGAPGGGGVGRRRRGPSGTKAPHGGSFRYVGCEKRYESLEVFRVTVGTERFVAVRCQTVLVVVAVMVLAVAGWDTRCAERLLRLSTLV